MDYNSLEFFGDYPPANFLPKYPAKEIIPIHETIVNAIAPIHIKMHRISIFILFTILYYYSGLLLFCPEKQKLIVRMIE